MRFFLECVTCCTAVSNASFSTEKALSPMEETRSLVAAEPTLTIRRRKKRTASKGAAADWKPSLFAISEDNAVSTTPQKVVNLKQVTPMASPKNVKRYNGPSTRSHEFGRDPPQMVFPAFTAAPFMF